MNHFLHKKSDDTYTYIFYDIKNSSLSMKRYGKRGSKSAVNVLRTNIEKDFYCAADKKGSIHIAFSVINGGIHYGYFTENSFHSYQILSAKSHMDYNKHIMISAGSDPVCIFYTINHNNKTILSMQNVNCTQNTSSSPVAIDYLADNEVNINLCENAGGNIFLAYPKEAAEHCTNVIREVSRDGTTLKLREYFSDIAQPLHIDCFYFEDEKSARILCHPISNDRIYMISIDNKITVEEIDISTLPRTRNTFYSMFSVYNKLHCCMCTDGILYSCVLRGGSQSVNLERQPRQYGGNIYPLHCVINDLSAYSFVVPGNLISGQFFYLFNPFSDLKNIEEVLDISRIISIEKRLASIEKYIKELEENKSTPRDVVDPDFDT